MADIDESILANLTEEERAALEAPDGDSEHQEVDLEQAAAQQQQQQEEQQNDDQEKKDTPEGEGKPEEQQQEEQKPEQQEQQQETPAPQPVFKPVATEELKAKYDDLDKRENELIEKFEEGELTTREYNAQLRDINKERGDLDWQQRKDELNRESVEQQVERQWVTDVKAFLPNHPAISESEENWQSFDKVLRLVTAARQAEGKPYGTPELERAYRIWSDEQGIKAPAPAKEDPKQEQQQEQKPKPKAMEIPPSLAKVPAAAPEDTDDGKFAALDRLADSDPQKYQESIARMSADEYAAYSSR